MRARRDALAVVVILARRLGWSEAEGRALPFARAGDYLAAVTRLEKKR